MPVIPFSVQASFTRPANTTAYTAKDVVNGSVAKPLRFPNIVPCPDMTFLIMSPIMVSTNSPTTVGSFKLLLFRVPPNTPVDHAVFAPTKEELGYYIGTIVFDTAIKINTGTIYTQDGFKLVWGMPMPGGVDIWGVLLDDVAYVPASEESIRIVLNGMIGLI